ncbi:hypothetical protein [Anaerosalibacter sp. Marseille-P3206]|uniref:hypothetical protein n=1 Tax=Anaerosalibacter sp. Marseille-P3206 TaxID=1871005 RepID=UPI0009841228|nr:hypothetical protein [Anaerosalibacter sp. Marseille-P3206]
MKDKFDLELKSIMDEETKNVFMPDELKNRIMEDTKGKSLKEKISAFLNRYIEIPLPAILGGLAAVMIINLMPLVKLNKDINYSDGKVIKVGYSEIIVRNVKDVDLHEKD